MNDALTPPPTVKWAVYLISFAFSLCLISWTITAHWHEPIVPFIILLSVTLIYLYVRAIWNGKNWARWVFTISNVMGLFGTPSAISHFHHPLEIARYVLQAIAGLIAIMLIFLPQSMPWFSGKRKTA